MNLLNFSFSVSWSLKFFSKKRQENSSSIHNYHNYVQVFIFINTKNGVHVQTHNVNVHVCV